ncbi:MAG: hypothetical protein E7548_06435 [Ruminococcaceae bacterium]|nr:hypothetical protein [Oscillospiraceae bacterium]
MDKRNWKIVYTNYSGMEKKAVELVSKEMGALTLRDAGVYRIYVLPCESAKTASLDRNCVIIGLFDENEIIRKYVSREKIKENGYVVKVFDNPENTEFKLAIITANDPAALFYGATDFVDDYFAFAFPFHGSLMLPHELFSHPLKDYYNASAPAIKNRSVFTWGHPINDYKNYIENMARLKLNELVIWNDYPPINAEDIVSYAHEFGIKVIWGFAWGWSRDCAAFDFNTLEKLSEDIVKVYEERYENISGDGIYFQSFTEHNSEKIGDVLIAEAVTKLVNTVSGKLLQKYPDLLIQFGLHASSVKNHLDFIAKVDSRVEIKWEDCGSFPYWYDNWNKTDESFNDTLKFTESIVNLRDNGAVSVLFKGFMTLDWTGDRFVHQAGPYVMGVNSDKLTKNDRNLLKPIWKNYQTFWFEDGVSAHTVARKIYESGKNAGIGLAGQFAGGIWFPEALCAQILWECDKDYDEIIKKVLKRQNVEIV